MPRVANRASSFLPGEPIQNAQLSTYGWTSAAANKHTHTQTRAFNTGTRAHYMVQVINNSHDGEYGPGRAQLEPRLLWVAQPPRNHYTIYADFAIAAIAMHWVTAQNQRPATTNTKQSTPSIYTINPLSTPHHRTYCAHRSSLPMVIDDAVRAHSHVWWCQAGTAWGANTAAELLAEESMLCVILLVLLKEMFNLLHT